MKGLWLFKSQKNTATATQLDPEEAQARQLSLSYKLGGWKRIYLIHIRKTGGTSLNNMFLSLGSPDPAAVYEQLAKSPNNRLILGNKVFVGWNVNLINQGHYYYAFSHTPLHGLKLPEKTFTLTCFRDPVKRVLSHYKMLMEFASNKIPHPCMLTEGKWLGSSFDDFLQNIPPEHLLNQLYMFSERFDLEQAVERVQSVCHYFFTEQFADGVAELNSKIGLSLQAIHIRKTEFRVELSEQTLQKLREKLNPEYVFLDRLRKLRQQKGF